MEDNVNHPSHYAEGWSNGAEVIDITENLNFNRGNAVKYIARAGKKDPEKELEDLAKAEFYLKREIQRISSGEPDLCGAITAVKTGESLLADWERELLMGAATRSSTSPAPALPRVWESMDDIPSRVNVRDKDNETWIAAEIAWEVSDGYRSEVLGADRFAPFTEETA